MYKNRDEGSEYSATCKNNLNMFWWMFLKRYEVVGMHSFALPICLVGQSSVC